MADREPEGLAKPDVVKLRNFYTDCMAMTNDVISAPIVSEDEKWLAKEIQSIAKRCGLI